MEPKCEHCKDRGHVADRWTGTYWRTVRGCGACGMKGDPSEFDRENEAKRKEARATS